MSTYTNILLHVVFSTKERVPVLTPDIRPRVHEYLGGAIRGNGGVPYEIGGTADHVHLLFRWIPNEEVSDLLREIKSGTSKWIKSEFRSLRNFGWQKGYGAFSVSHSEKQRVVDYIQNQEKHHRKRSFKEEFVGLLKLNEIEYDEHYIWD
jgi:putative transposase